MKITVKRKRIKNIYLRINDEGAIEVTAPVWYTDEKIREFVESKRGWISRALDRQIKRKSRDPLYLSHPELKDDARKILRLRIEERLPLMEKRTGLKANGWSIRDMKTRWGSCNIETHHLNFNLRLVNRSDRELDYIILHELCHTVYRYHDKNFWGLVEKYMPDWRTVRREMRE